MILTNNIDERGTEQLVALKKVLTDCEKEGFPITALREINLLKQLKNENVKKRTSSILLFLQASIIKRITRLYRNLFLF
jgi:hypothetical protein